MKTATVRDLRYRFPEVERALSTGQTITITKRGRPVAQLSPPQPARPGKIKVPDIMARLRSIYGDRVFETSGAELVAWGRDRD